ncbi:MAG: PhoX family phosphatase [Halomonadaceae bacterium]|nr:MAG: PhoX family phosphatase [Halomonadaceae bacterium]
MTENTRNGLVVVDNGEGDEALCNLSGNQPFADVLQARLGRRGVLKGSLGLAAGGLFGVGLTGCLSSSDSSDRSPSGSNGDTTGGSEVGPLLGFQGVPVSEADRVVVPEGYSYQVLMPWGEPITGSYPMFLLNNSGADQGMQVGMHHDGMHFYPIEGDDPYEGSSTDGLLVMNHEYVEPRFMHASAQGQSLNRGGVPVKGDGTRAADEVLKEMNGHGVTIARINKGLDNQWSVRADARNRRVTALTPMEIAGPVRGSSHVVTKYSPEGSATRGTINNCAHGVTPWGTYLAAEENWAGYFINKGARPREQSRYGVRSSGTGRYAWELADNGADEYVRFNVTATEADATQDYRNEAHCFGWVVEIDPFNPDSKPQKRTALGRFAHEGVVFHTAEEGKPLVGYSGDDAQFEYIYKFVSKNNYFKSTADGRLLDEGTLYVAKFNDDGTGEWLELTFGKNGLIPENDFANQADVLVNTRTAADFVGATPMDRPEWGAIDPANGDVYFTLTNNSNRDNNNRPGVDEANPRPQNRHGHIIRWAEDGGDPTATSFAWDIFVLGGDSGQSGVESQRGFVLVGDEQIPLTDDNIFSSPDGLWIDPASRMWIQMDMSEGVMNTNPTYAMMGNNAMLAANTGTGEIRRFLTGPLGQEITGVITTPDQRTMFINVQHPGATTTAEEWAGGELNGTWPDHDPLNKPPRSATVVIWKDDGGVIGS